MSKPYTKIKETTEPSKTTWVIMGWNKRLYIELMKGKKFTVPETTDDSMFQRKAA